MAHYQSRPLLFLLQPICLANPLISGCDFEVMSRHDLFSVPSVLMSRPLIDVAASLSSYSSSVCVATSDLGCDHIDVCMTTSYVSILCLDLMVMSRHGFLLFFLFLFFRLQPQFYVATNSQVTTSKWCRDFSFFCSALLQVATLFSGCDITSGP